MALPKGSYDFIANLPNQNDNFTALQEKLRQQWGVVGKPEMRNEDVMVLKVKSAPALKTASPFFYMLWKD